MSHCFWESLGKSGLAVSVSRAAKNEFCGCMALREHWDIKAQQNASFNDSTGFLAGSYEKLTLWPNFTLETYLRRVWRKMSLISANDGSLVAIIANKKSSLTSASLLHCVTDSMLPWLSASIRKASPVYFYSECCNRTNLDFKRTDWVSGAQKMSYECKYMSCVCSGMLFCTKYAILHTFRCNECIFCCASGIRFFSEENR